MPATNGASELKLVTLGHARPYNTAGVANITATERQRLFAS